LNNCSKIICLLGVIVVTLLGPVAASAQPQVSVSPASISAQAAQGTNAPSQTVSIGTGGNRTWSITSKNGSWFSVSPTSGSRRGTVAVSFQSASLGAGTYNGSFVAATDVSSATVSVQLTISGSSSSGGSTAPPPPPPPPSTSGVGPQSTITCPSGAVSIYPGTAIQGVVDTYGGSTTFCLRAGTHSLRNSITPKTGDIFVGEYGAILDGTGWSTSDDTQAAFRAHNQDIDYVTIRNLVIRNMPKSGIHTYYWMSDHWTSEYNEIASNKIGIELSPNFIVRNNYIHHNVGINPYSSNPAERGGGYQGFRADNTTFDSNEIAYNGLEQKVGLSANVTFRNNFVHHNLRDGIWYDTNPNGGSVIDGNRVEDNGRIGISFESSVGATISNNAVRRNAGDGIFISMSQNAQIYSNTIEANFGGIEYFLNCDSLSLGEDVKNNAAHDNTVVVGTQSYTYASAFSYLSSCTSTLLAPYLNGSKSLTFSRNTYRVPSLSYDRYFFWGAWKYWSEWQAMGQDAGGGVSQ